MTGWQRPVGRQEPQKHPENILLIIQAICDMWTHVAHVRAICLVTNSAAIIQLVVQSEQQRCNAAKKEHVPVSTATPGQYKGGRPQHTRQSVLCSLERQICSRPAGEPLEALLNTSILFNHPPRRAWRRTSGQDAGTAAQATRRNAAPSLLPQPSRERRGAAANLRRQTRSLAHPPRWMLHMTTRQHIPAFTNAFARVLHAS